MEPLHGGSAELERLSGFVHTFLNTRFRSVPLGRTASVAAMDEALRDCITVNGLGIDGAWTLMTDVVLRNTIGIDSERFLAFIPVSPSVASAWADAVVGATSVPAESWLEAAGAVAAENQVLVWLASLAGMPANAGGCFMSGGSIGNLSALAVARQQRPDRRCVAVADTAHASVYNTLHLLGMEAFVVPTAEDGRFTSSALRHVIGDRADVGAVVGSAGSTNAGLIDDLAGLARVSHDIGAWFHVDAAYGGAALLLSEFADRMRGMALADSFIVDPHKWLFAPAGSCALIYRDPSLAKAVHTQHGPYIDVLRHDGDEWNPADFGYQLTRRATGLPLWFSLVLHGTESYESAVRRGVELAGLAADLLRQIPNVSLVLEPELSVVLFRRAGWDAAD